VKVTVKSGQPLHHHHQEEGGYIIMTLTKIAVDRNTTSIDPKGHNHHLDQDLEIEKNTNLMNVAAANVILNEIDGIVEIRALLLQNRTENDPNERGTTHINIHPKHLIRRKRANMMKLPSIHPSLYLIEMIWFPSVLSYRNLHLKN
jgi:hypothetical protein